MRADFLRLYGLDVEEVPIGEMWDMVLAMPRGARTLALVDPRAAWTEEAYLLADIFDLLNAIGSGLGGRKSAPKPHARPEPPKERGPRVTHGQMMERLNRDRRETGHDSC